MEIGVRVESENYLTGEVRHTASAYLTFVAVDETGKPKEVPGLIFENDAEKRRNKEALLRKKARIETRTKEDNCQNKGLCPI
jgi:acyl-CoA hydrolase